MRILLAHHAPLQLAPVGRHTWLTARALVEAGHEVRLLIADSEHHFGELPPVERVVCGSDPNADLRFSLPRFPAENATPDRPTFADLPDAELAQYRDCLRRRLDHLIMHFDPQVIHVQHVWSLGQLALESGVPYVLNAWPDELDAYPLDERYQPLAEQAAENASRIFVRDETLRQRVEALFEITPERLVVLPGDVTELETDPAARQTLAHRLQHHYQALLEERFG